MSSLPPNRWTAEDFFEIEQLIAGAREFVVPSEGLRARVIDSAAAIDRRHVHWAKLKRLFLTIFLAWLFFALVYLLVSLDSQSNSRTGDNANPSSVYPYMTHSGDRTP